MVPSCLCFSAGNTRGLGRIQLHVHLFGHKKAEGCLSRLWVRSQSGKILSLHFRFSRFSPMDTSCLKARSQLSASLQLLTGRPESTASLPTFPELLKHSSVASSMTRLVSNSYSPYFLELLSKAMQWPLECQRLKTMADSRALSQEENIFLDRVLPDRLFGFSMKMKHSVGPEASSLEPQCASESLRAPETTPPPTPQTVGLKWE